MSATQGQDYVQVVSADDESDIRVSVNGQPAEAIIVPMSGGQFRVTVDGDSVKCPGPIIFEGITSPPSPYEVDIDGC